MKNNYSNHFQALADRFGDRQALVNLERDRRYSYRELHQLTNQIANMMRTTLGLGDGDCFINILDNDNMALLHVPTILKGAATGVFTNYRDALKEHVWQVEYAKPKVAFIENVLLDTHFDMLRHNNVAVVCMDPLEGQWKQKQEGLFYFWDLVMPASTANPDIEIDDRQHTCVIRFTGGTTGKGKPAAYSPDNWMAMRDSFFALPDCDCTADSRVLHLAPISHGSAMLLLPTFYSGGCNVTLNEPDLLKYCQAIQDEKITTSMLVPTLLYRLLELPEDAPFDFSTLDTMIYGAAPMSQAKLKRLQARFGNIFMQIYGSTEHCAVTLSLSKSAHVIAAGEESRRLSAAGQITSGVEVLIADEQGQPVKKGDVGELWLRSRATVLGYYQNPEKTAEEFVDGFWRSGDMGRMDEEGFVYIVDRKKDMIISGGFNVYATEVEAAINSHDAILMSAVVGIPHEDWGEAVHAEVMLRPGASVTEEALIAYVKGVLGSYKAPKSISIVDQLPVSVVGKVLRRQVRNKYWQLVEVEG